MTKKFNLHHRHQWLPGTLMKWTMMMLTQNMSSFPSTTQISESLMPWTRKNVKKRKQLARNCDSVPFPRHAAYQTLKVQAKKWSKLNSLAHLAQLAAYKRDGFPSASNNSNLDPWKKLSHKTSNHPQFC